MNFDHDRQWFNAFRPHNCFIVDSFVVRVRTTARKLQ